MPEELDVVNGFPPLPTDPVQKAESFRTLYQQDPVAALNAMHSEELAKHRAELFDVSKRYSDQLVKMTTEFSEWKKKETEELWEKRKKDHQDLSLMFAAQEESAYVSAKSALSVKAEVFQLLRAPVKQPKTGGELALKGFKQVLDKIENQLDKHPQLLGGFTKLLAEAAATTDEEQRPAENAADATTSETTVGSISLQNLCERLNALSDDLLKGRKPEELSLEEALSLVSANATRSS